MTMKIFSFGKVLMLLSVILLSCKKDKNVDPLNGIWELTQNQGYGSRLKFGPGQKFSMILTYADSSNHSMTQNGEFSIKGDSLFVNISEVVEKLNAQTEGKTSVNYTLFDKATFDVRGSKLSLNYITYPADAPVATQMIYTQVDMID
ncbi:hypothetical protein [Pedobacter immunditicola]|uniref:hypothetical protein n=1 Tax=Pedobacter immunditicola TaxID=3133440 RepID=UPI0030B00D03